MAETPRQDGDDRDPLDGPDWYVERGRVVFTAAYHLRRGWCCGNDCRHCPYDGEDTGDRAARRPTEGEDRRAG